jgi:hypothetical protein
MSNALDPTIDMGIVLSVSSDTTVVPDIDNEKI